MIVFDLVCDAAHQFEAWFGSSADFDDQQARRLLACPMCGSVAIGKAVMAPAVPAKSNRSADAAGRDPLAQLLMLQRAVEAGSDYVGDRFAAEARRLHEAGIARRIHGEASISEAKALIEDGIPLLPLPFRPRARSDA